MAKDGDSTQETHALRAENERLQKRVAELEMIEERYQLAMDGSNEGLWEWHPVTKDLYISSRLMETLGHQNVGHQTTTHQWLEWVHPDDIAGYEKKVSEHLKGQSDFFEWEYRVKDTQGIYHWVFARGKALRDDKGIAYRMVGSVGDITERKLASEKLKQAYDQLEHRVEERTKALVLVNKQLNKEVEERRAMEKELKIAKDIAEQANLSKDKYLAAASHDLLRPLNAARLLVSTLQERELGEKDHSLVNRIHNALNNAEELLSDLLDIAKLDANALSSDIRTVQVNRIIQPLKDEFESVAQKAHVYFRVMPSRLYVQTDAHLLSRILRNFLSNAIRYSAGGRVLLGCRRMGGHIRFQVWDTGPGIPTDKFNEIFQEFKQLKDNTPTQANKGVGLGLAIVERIAQMLGLQVSVQSQLGKGSVFSVDVPISHAPALSTTTNPQDTSQAGQVDLKGVGILIVDNEGSITHSMADLLVEWGATPHCALSKSSALSEIKYSNKLPRVVLADYHLEQGETGIEVIEEIHEQYNRLIPGVIISADRSKKLKQECERLGYYLLNKPLKPAKLRALLNHILSE